MYAVAEPVDGAHIVVIVEDQQRLGPVYLRLDLFDILPEVTGVKLGARSEADEHIHWQM